MYIKELQNCQVELRFSTRACVNKLDNDVFDTKYQDKTQKSRKNHVLMNIIGIWSGCFSIHSWSPV